MKDILNLSPSRLEGSKRIKRNNSTRSLNKIISRSLQKIFCAAVFRDFSQVINIL